MEKRDHRYAGAGLAIGTGIAGALCITAFALTGNPTYIAFTGVGTAFGLLIGAAIDSRKSGS